MRKAMMTASVLLALTASARAQNSEPVTVGSEPPSTTWHETCVEVEIGGSKSYDCINDRFKRQVDQINPVENMPPFAANSQDVKIGLFNEAGVKEQFGQNFGHSVFPFRPPPPNFGIAFSPGGRVGGR
jgi:hypothetical protein